MPAERSTLGLPMRKYLLKSQAPHEGWDYTAKPDEVTGRLPDRKWKQGETVHSPFNLAARFPNKFQDMGPSEHKATSHTKPWRPQLEQLEMGPVMESELLKVDGPGGIVAQPLPPGAVAQLGVVQQPGWRTDYAIDLAACTLADLRTVAEGEEVDISTCRTVEEAAKALDTAFAARKPAGHGV